MTRQLQRRATLGHDALSSVATWVRKFGVVTHSFVSRHGLAASCRDRSGGQGRPALGEKEPGAHAERGDTGRRRTQSAPCAHRSLFMDIVQ